MVCPIEKVAPYRWSTVHLIEKLTQEGLPLDGDFARYAKRKLYA